MTALMRTLLLAALMVLGAFPATALEEKLDEKKALRLSHAGKRKVECRRRTREELAKMPANMRASKECPRERWPVYVEMELDGKAIMGESARPKGLAKDGPSIFYRAFPVTAGTHGLSLSLRDKGDAGTDYRKQQEIELAPGQVLAIEFDASKGGFILQ